MAAPIFCANADSLFAAIQTLATDIVCVWMGLNGGEQPLVQIQRGLRRHLNPYASNLQNGLELILNTPKSDR